MTRYSSVITVDDLSHIYSPDYLIRNELAILIGLMVSNQVISTLAQYFGKEMVLKSLEAYKDRVSQQLFTTVLNYLNHTKNVA